MEELRRELAEAREQLAATSDVLRVISSSPTDLQRVFAGIAASAARLCDAYDATIFQADGDILCLVGHHGPIPSTAHGTPLKRGIVTAHASLTDERYRLLICKPKLMRFQRVVSLPDAMVTAPYWQFL
jgi:two-component system, NtrC family, sensor kinase